MKTLLLNLLGIVMILIAVPFVLVGILTRLIVGAFVTGWGYAHVFIANEGSAG